MIRHLNRRVHAIERHLSPTGPCTTCNGKGHLVVRWTDFPPELGGLGDGTKHNGSPCPACGKATVINIVMTDQITPNLQQADTT